MLAVLPLLRHVVELGLGVVLTTVTVTSAAVAEQRLPPGVVHQFAPLDVPAYVERFLDAWQPELAVFVESEIWPATLGALERRDVPVVVCNARMSDRSFRRWRRLGRGAEAVFGRIHLCLAQTAEDAERFRVLGVPRARSIGNIKFDAPPPETTPQAAAALRAAFGGRPVVLAASTHPGEDEIVLDAFATLQRHLPNALAVIAPRHPERGPAVMSLAVGRALGAAQRSAGMLPSADTAVYVADTVGELGTLYALASVAIVGGSLVPPGGGHNPIEPAALGIPAVIGPHAGNFRQIVEAMTAARAISVASGAAAIAEAAERLIRHPVERGRQIEAALAVIAAYRGALGRTIAAIEPFLNPLVVTARLARSERS
jgi:3-deoxy-D-manno-octulosonic-acid transferase